MVQLNVTDACWLLDLQSGSVNWWSKVLRASDRSTIRELASMSHRMQTVPQACSCLKHYEVELSADTVTAARCMSRPRS
jgi:hypothetical protein